MDPTRFLLTHYAGGSPGLATMRAVLGVYDAMGRQWTHRLHSVEDLAGLVPGLAQQGLTRSDMRLGLLSPGGGGSLLPAVRAICQPELGWDDVRWQAEEARYREIWSRSYSVPAETISS